MPLWSGCRMHRRSPSGDLRGAAAAYPLLLALGALDATGYSVIVPVAPVIADPDMDDATRSDMQQWTGCVAGALTRVEFEQALAEAGLTDIELRETHRVHQHATSAIIRASKPEES